MIRETGRTERGKAVTLCLFVFLALDAGLLIFGLSDSFGGYHGFNEAWYSIVAENYSSHSFLTPTTYENTIDLNIPPLLSYLLYASFSLFGRSEFAARLVPLAFSILSLVGTYLLCRWMMRREAALEAVALLASTPIFLLVGGNVQTDMLFVSLSLLFTFFYLKARQSGKRSHVAVAGLFLGTALLSKQFAIIPLAAIVLWELLGSKRTRLLRSDFILLLVVGGLVVTPFYGYHLLRDPAYLIGSQLHGSASRAGFATGPTLRFLLGETLSGCSPLFLAGSLAGMGLMFFHLNRRKLLIGLSILAYFTFYLFLHKHSYYFLGMIPFLALCFTELSENLPNKIYDGLLILTVATATLFSAYQLEGRKYGFDEFKHVGEQLRAYQRPVLLIDHSVSDSYGPVLKYYASNATLLLQGSTLSSSDREKLRTADKVFSLTEIPVSGSANNVLPIQCTRYGVKIGNRVYIHVPPNIHFFEPSLPTEPHDYQIIGSFGPFVKLELPSFYMVVTPS